MVASGVLSDRYEIVRQLGRGGAGELLLVRDRKAGLEYCALKILKPRRPDPGLAPLFRSEFLLLSDVRHPSIVAVRDFSLLDSGEPCFTMAYVPGENCRTFVGTDRLEPHEYVELASGLLGALAVVHARGIVHRDVKPENVIMQRGDGHLLPCLVDFGLAVLSAATRCGEATGTLPYIAPEVLAGGVPDPRSDLFALGMLLYEVCTGKQPAARKELLGEPQRWLAPDNVRRSMNRAAHGSVPPRFEDFVCRLTAPTPAGRFSSAVAALDALRELYGEDAVGEPVDVAVRPLVSEAPLVGRKAALDALSLRVEAMQEGLLLDPIVVVAGAEGSGVTRLLAALRNHAAVSGCLVCTGAGLMELVRDIASHPAIDAAPPAPSEGASELVFRADTALHSLPQSEWAVLILDDVHAMSEAECAALRQWVTALEGRGERARVLLVLGGRNQGDGPGAELLRTAGRAVPVELRDLAPLSAADIRGALSIVLGTSSVPSPAVQSLHRACDGNARLFSELLRLLVDEQVLGFEAGEPVMRAEKLEAMDLPRGLVEIARRRAAHLDPDSLALLARFALIRTPLSYPAASELAGDRLAALLDGRFLVRDRGRIGFAHELARQAADSLEGEERRHALIETATALLDETPVTAALLLAEAGELERAREVGLPAARELVSSRRLERARVLLEALAGASATGEVGALMVRVDYLSGRVEEAARLGRRLVKEQADNLDLFMTVVSAQREAGRPEQALEALDGAEQRAEGAAAARLINARASMLNTLGRYDEALEASLQAEEAQGSLFDERGALARTRANILRFAGRRTSARAMEDAIVAAFEPGSATRAIALANSANFRRHGGRMLEAIRLCRRAVRESHSRPVLLARAWWLLGTALLDCGRPARALSCVEKARALFEGSARVSHVRETLDDIAMALLVAGRPTEAEACMRRGAQLPGRLVGLTWVNQERLPTEALLAHLSGRLEDALAICGDRARGGARAEAAVLVARIRMAQGDLDAAEGAWRVALRQAWQERRKDLLARVRVGLAECAGQRGGWRLAESILDRGRSDLLELKTSLRARALIVRAAASASKGEPASAARRIEEAVAVANRTGSAPLIAEVYAAAASLLEEPGLQRHLRRPTAEASAALLEAARDIWATYGNETMLRKIDLHLSELPRLASDPLGSPDADLLVKVLHVVREMNQQFDRDRLLQLILDRAIELTAAERGFVILLEEGRQEVQIARNIDRESLSEPEHKLSSQIIAEVVKSGRIVRSEDAETDARFGEFLSVRQLHLKSVVAVPFRSGAKTVGAIYLDNRWRTGNFGEREERLLGLFADQAVTAIEKAQLIRQLKASKGELEDLHRQQKLELKRQGTQLQRAQREITQHRKARGLSFERVIARSVAMQAVVREARRFADSDLPVLLTGENGAGKETLAMAMHYESRRSSMPCMVVNVSAFAEPTLEAELFGHVRSGGDRDRPGLFEEANGGTLFVDEIGDLSPPLQVRLLRTLDSGEVQRVGESRPRAVDVRLIAAAEVDLRDLVRSGKFREDLYYRVSGFVLHVPPLRERLEDIEPLAYALVEEVARREGRPELEISSKAIARLESYPWSGNVRELRNVILRAVVTAEEEVIRPEDIAFDTGSAALLPGFDPDNAERVVSGLAGHGLDLNERQQTAVARVLARGKLAYGEYRKLFRICKSTTSRDLEGLIQLEVLEKRGRTRAVVYLPGPKLREVAKKTGRE